MIPPSIFLSTDGVRKVNKILRPFWTVYSPDYCRLCGLPACARCRCAPACERELQVNSACCYSCAIPLPPPVCRPRLPDPVRRLPAGAAALPAHHRALVCIARPWPT